MDKLSKLTSLEVGKLISVMALALLTGCGINLGDEDDTDLTSKFNGTWNIYESIERHGDGSITYYALPWGGLVGSVKDRNMPADWSGYESLVVEYAEPTKVTTQLMISDNLKTLGKPGITSLTCNLDGQNVKAVDEVALQAADTTTLTVRRIYLVPNTAVWDSMPIWTGRCAFGNWENGFVVKPEYFTSAYPGDKLEFIFTTDPSNPNPYWQIKTIYNDGTDTTVEGNASELNDWGCATVGAKSTVYRITLTENDVKMLKKTGMFVNGYYTTVTKCNLLRKDYVEAGA